MKLEEAAEKYYFTFLSEGDTIYATDYIFGFLKHDEPTLVKTASCMHGIKFSSSLLPILRPVILKSSEMPYDYSKLYEVVLAQDINEQDLCLEYFSRTFWKINEQDHICKLVKSKQYTVAIRKVKEHETL